MRGRKPYIDDFFAILGLKLSFSKWKIGIGYRPLNIDYQ